MLLNARKVFYEEDPHSTLLLAIEDVTERRVSEREVQRQLQRQDLLFEEMQHRIANSLQLIASILVLKARTVKSDETRLHLHDTHKRVLSVAAAHKHLQAIEGNDLVDIGPYLGKLCKSLGDSMIDDDRSVSLDVEAQPGSASTSAAVNLGLIVTECVINALKHAFSAKATDGRIRVAYQVEGSGWRLSISDNGAGMSAGGPHAGKPGLGTSIVNALAEQLEAKVDVGVSPSGTIVSITHASCAATLPAAA